jgi:hypothetical protein
MVRLPTFGSSFHYVRLATAKPSDTVRKHRVDTITARRPAREADSGLRVRGRADEVLASGM